jgi:hypothetical protein
MSSARLEVIKDDAAIPPYMSRGMPAALDGLLSQATFDEFCDTLDASFDLLDSEHKRRKKRFWWMYATISFYFIMLSPLVTLTSMNLMSMIFWPLTLIACAVHITTVWFCTARGVGVKSDKEMMRVVRSECDEMTRRIPFISFHVVLVPTAAAARGAWLQMETIDHIGVSVSLSASASGVATTANAVMAHTHDSKIDESSDNNHPVVYAQAVASSTTANGNYQQVRDVEMV